MAQLRKSKIGGLRQLLLNGFPQAVWKRPSAFPHSHRPDDGSTAKSENFRQCRQLLKTHSSLTEAIHFGNDVHPQRRTGLTHWILCLGTVEAFRSESLVGFAGIRNLFVGDERVRKLQTLA